MSGRGYMEAKEMGKDKGEKMKELENYMKELSSDVTEMIGEPTLAKVLGVSAHRIARTIHAHPSMHEAVMEAAEDALGCSIHM